MPMMRIQKKTVNNNTDEYLQNENFLDTDSEKASAISEISKTFNSETQETQEIQEKPKTSEYEQLI